jgi:hypothetical protein
MQTAQVGLKSQKLLDRTAALYAFLAPVNT